MSVSSHNSGKIVVVGASGFGRETLDVLEAMRTSGLEIDIHGVLDDSPSTENLERLRARKIEFLGSTDAFLSSGDKKIKYVIGIGNPKVKEKIAGKFDQFGFHPFTAIHPSVILGSQTEIKPGSVICAGAIISTNVQLGFHTHLNPGVVIGHDSILSDFVSINPSATISGEVLILQSTLVGANATVLQGLTVGHHSIIGAAAVVTKDIPSDVVAMGIPARW